MISLLPSRGIYFTLMTAFVDAIDQPWNCDEAVGSSIFDSGCIRKLSKLAIAKSWKASNSSRLIMAYGKVMVKPLKVYLPW